MLSKCNFVDTNVIDFRIKSWHRNTAYRCMFMNGERVIWTTEVALVTEYNIDQEKSSYVCNEQKIKDFKELIGHCNLDNAKLVRFFCLLEHSININKVLLITLAFHVHCTVIFFLTSTLFCRS